MPTFGSASSRKTSSHLAASARAMAQPITPPPMITMLACSMVVVLSPNPAPHSDISLAGAALVCDLKST
jgi:hypothetical protein